VSVPAQQLDARHHVALETIDAEAFLQAVAAQLGGGIDAFDLLLALLLDPSPLRPPPESPLAALALAQLKATTRIGKANAWVDVDAERQQLPVQPVRVPSASNHNCTSALVWMLFLALAHPSRVKERHRDALVEYLADRETGGRAELAEVAKQAATRAHSSPPSLVVLGRGPTEMQ
jgi:hypothetical protein